jgi:hypothetical protein
VAFLTETQAKEAVAGALKTSSAALPDYWDGIVSESRDYAHAQVVSRLKGRGYTDDEIAAWGAAGEQAKGYERRILLEEALTRGGMLDDYDEKFIRQLRRVRLELDLLTLAT